MFKNEKNSFIETNEIFVVSYDVFGYGLEIETYLFSASQVDEQQVAHLRSDYERENMEKVLSDTHDDVKSFELWVIEKGIWCSKVRQLRVQPKIEGHSEDYDAICLENETAFC